MVCDGGGKGACSPPADRSALGDQIGQATFPQCTVGLKERSGAHLRLRHLVACRLRRLLVAVAAAIRSQRRSGRRRERERQPARPLSQTSEPYLLLV